MSNNIKNYFDQIQKYIKSKYIIKGALNSLVIGQLKPYSYFIVDGEYLKSWKIKTLYKKTKHKNITSINKYSEMIKDYNITKSQNKKRQQLPCKTVNSFNEIENYITSNKKFKIVLPEFFHSVSKKNIFRTKNDFNMNYKEIQCYIGENKILIDFNDKSNNKYLFLLFNSKEYFSLIIKNKDEKINLIPLLFKENDPLNYTKKKIYKNKVSKIFYNKNNTTNKLISSNNINNFNRSMINTGLVMTINILQSLTLLFAYENEIRMTKKFQEGKYVLIRTSWLQHFKYIYLYNRIFRKLLPNNYKSYKYIEDNIISIVNDNLLHLLNTPINFSDNVINNQKFFAKRSFYREENCFLYDINVLIPEILLNHILLCNEQLKKFIKINNYSILNVFFNSDKVFIDLKENNAVQIGHILIDEFYTCNFIPEYAIIYKDKTVKNFEVQYLKNKSLEGYLDEKLYEVENNNIYYLKNEGCDVILGKLIDVTEKYIEYDDKPNIYNYNYLYNLSIQNINKFEFINNNIKNLLNNYKIQRCEYFKIPDYNKNENIENEINTTKIEENKQIEIPKN